MKNSIHKKPYSRKTKITIFVIVVMAIVLLGAFTVKINQVNKELNLWKSREDVLREDLKNLKLEASKNREFLEKLRKDPEIQNAVARRELGYAESEERVFRFETRK